MQCPEFETRLNEILDNRQPPEADQELLAHTACCGTCSQLLHSYTAMLDSFQRLKTPALSPHFATSVVQATLASGPWPTAASEFSFTEDLLAAEPVNVSLRRPYNPAPLPQRKTRFFQVAAWGTIASCAAALLLLVALRIRSSANPAAAQPLGHGTAIALTGKAPSTPLPVGTPLASTPLPGPKSAPEASLTHVSYGSYDEYRSALTSFSEQIPQAVEHLEDVDTLAPGIRPIRASFSTAIDTLRRTIPKGRHEQRQLRPATGALELSSDCWV